MGLLSLLAYVGVLAVVHVDWGDALALVTAAVTLEAHGAVQVSTAEQAAQALRPAGPLFAAGIVGTGNSCTPLPAGE